MFAEKIERAVRIPKRRQKNSERKEVHQIFQRRGILISGKAESSGIPGREDEICTSHQCRYDFHFTACFPFQPLLHLFSPSPPFSHPPRREEKQTSLRYYLDLPPLLLPRRNAYKVKQTIPSSSSSSFFTFARVCDRHARPRDEEWEQR